jgi:microcystin degradation protein MlrC
VAGDSGSSAFNARQVAGPSGRKARPRILLAGLFHETHTFLDGTTMLADFQCRLDKEILTARGDGSPLDGFLEVAERYGWQVVPTIDMRATPSAIVEDGVVSAFWEELRPRLERSLAEGMDAIYLVLHGAMASESYPDVEGELLERLNRTMGANALPVFGVYDLHANVSPRMARFANGLAAYREHPHTDAREAAMRAAELLARSLETGVRPVMSLAQPPVMWPPTGTGTKFEPMVTLEAAARRLEHESRGIWAISVAAGYSFADTHDTGVSFLAVAPDSERLAVDAALAELSGLALKNRRQGDGGEPAAAEVLDRILSIEDGPVVIAEPSDNIGGGAPGDATGLLRALLERDVASALVIVNGPAAVARLQGLEPGATVTLDVGGKGSRLDPGPVRLEVELVSRSNGRFRLEDPHSHLASMSGMQADMGPSAVVRHRGITLLLTSRKTPPFDLGQLRSQGIEPTGFQILCVKAAVAHRQVYDPIAAAHYSVDTPGPCSSNLRSLPFRRIRRPIHPLDPLDESAPSTVTHAVDRAGLLEPSED